MIAAHEEKATAQRDHLAHDHDGHHAHDEAAHPSASLNHVALSATIHCLTGCAIGEVLGMVIGTALGWGNWETVALAVGLAFVSGYGTTLLPLARAGMPLSTALPLAFASDTLSITTKEIVDNALMWLIPGAMNAELTDPVFWDSLFVSLILAGVAAFPVNLWLIQRGRGPAVAHAHLY
jgi:hypothetical protein